MKTHPLLVLLMYYIVLGIMGGLVYADSVVMLSSERELATAVFLTSVLV